MYLQVNVYFKYSIEDVLFHFSRPIHDAVENDHFELVRLFLACGADPTLTSYTGRTLISMAKTPEMRTFLKGKLTLQHCMISIDVY